MLAGTASASSAASSLRFGLFSILLGVLAGCVTPDDIRNERHLYREETLPMPASQVDDYVMRIVTECRNHYILRLIEPAPDNPKKLSAVVQNARVSAVIDFEETKPGSTRVRAYVPNQIFKGSGIDSMFDALLNPCFQIERAAGTRAR